MKTRERTFTLTGKGWMLFCPIYLPQGWETSPELMPFPRWRMWLLLDAAFAVQQGLNWLVSFFNPEACGFGVFARPMPPRQITIKVYY
jgi:hypothetical protein